MGLKVPFINLSKQYLEIKEEIDIVVSEVLRSGNYILGSNVAAFEKELAEYCDCNYSVGVASGTDALLLSLMAMDVKPGDEVITTPFTFVATANTVSRLGAVPVFVDISPETYNIDPTKIESKISKKTKGILPVHIFGNPASMTEVTEIAEHYDLFVIEDAAQAIGAKHEGKKVGGLGDTGTLSFFPTKNLGAIGDGGAVLTNKIETRNTLDFLRKQGASRKYYHDVIGINSRIDEVQAAILRVKLRSLARWTGNRREIANYYNEALRTSDFVLPFERKSDYHVYHQYSIQVMYKRDEFQKYMSDNGVETIVYYPYPLHLQPAFASLGYREGDLPVAEKVSKHVISLPCYPGLSGEDLESICNLIMSYK